MTRDRAHMRCLLMAVIAFVVALMIPAAAYGEEIVTRVRCFQEYKVNASGLPVTFSYRITPETADAPLPTASDGTTVSTFDLTRNDELWLSFVIDDDTISSGTTTVYRYTLDPVKHELTSGLYYVDLTDPSLIAGVNVYYLELHVIKTDEGNTTVVPLVHVGSWDGPKETDPGWRIAWNAPQDDQPTPVRPSPFGPIYDFVDHLIRPIGAPVSPDNSRDTSERNATTGGSEAVTPVETHTNPESQPVSTTTSVTTTPTHTSTTSTTAVTPQTVTESLATTGDPSQTHVGTFLVASVVTLLLALVVRRRVGERHGH